LVVYCFDCQMFVFSGRCVFLFFAGFLQSAHEALDGF
jgi:hypothetical protein